MKNNIGLLLIAHFHYPTGQQPTNKPFAFPTRIKTNKQTNKQPKKNQIKHTKQEENRKAEIWEKETFPG